MVEVGQIREQTDIGILDRACLIVGDVESWDSAETVVVKAVDQVLLVVRGDVQVKVRFHVLLRIRFLVLFQLLRDKLALILAVLARKDHHQRL